MALETDLLRTFVAVADVGSFTRAAPFLNLTQSAISLQMRKLEERAGSPLFERTGRGVKLTDAGRALLPYAQKLLATEQEATAALRLMRSAPRVRVGMPDVYAEQLLAGIVDALARFDVGLEVCCDVSWRLEERLRRAELDVALVVEHEERGGEVLLEDPLAWAASERLEVSPDDPVPLALYPNPCTYRARALAALVSAERAFTITFVTQATAAIDLAVDMGLGVAVRSRSTLRPGWRELDEDHGLPALQPAVLRLHLAPDSQRPEVERVAEQLRSTTPALLAG